MTTATATATATTVETTDTSTTDTTIKVDPRLLCSIIRSVEFACAGNGLRYSSIQLAFNGDSIRAIATDGRRIVCNTLPCITTETATFSLPFDAHRQLLDIGSTAGAVQFSIPRDIKYLDIVVTWKQRNGEKSLSFCGSGHFPDCDRLIQECADRQHNGVLTVHPVLDPVRSGEGSLQESGDLVAPHPHLTIVCKKGRPPYGVTFNLQYLAEWFGTLSPSLQAEISFGGKSDMMLGTCGASLYVLMPCKK